MNRDDRQRLQDMVDYSREVVAFVEGAARESFDADLKLVRAETYSIGVVGEAASHISSEIQESTPQIPWRKAIGMRNFLFHGYIVVNYDILWETATVSIPALMVELEKLVPPEGVEGE
jgi:uncharacterized protein with HEPN domain